MWLIPIVIGAYLLRVIPQLNHVFTDSGILFRGVDPYHHLRLIDNMMANFPQALAVDYYALPGGMPVGFPPLLNWIVVLISKLGIDYEIVAAFLPAILGALIAIPVYLIGKNLFNRTVGYISAALVVFLPTELLNRSLLGFIDHHVLEAFLIAWVIYFTVKLIKTGKIKWGIFGGIALGLYINTWLGGMFFVGVLSVALFLQYIYRPSKELLTGWLVMYVIAYALTFMYYGQPYYGGNLIIMPVIIAGIALLYLYLWNRKTAIIILSVLGVCALGGLSYLYGNDLAFALRSVFWGFESTISEAQPSYPYVFTGTLGVCALLMFPGAYFAARKGNVFLVVIWLIVFIAMIGQRRWGYYGVIPISLLSAYTVYYLSTYVQANLQKSVIIVALVFLLIPSAKTIIGVASQPTYINERYQEALVWLKDNSESPYDNFYYDNGAYYSMEALGQPKYTVLAWWDYGHWISRVAKRIPMSNPAAQISIEMRQYLMAQSQDIAESYIVDLAVQPKYIFATKEMTTENKYYAIVYQLGMSDAEVEQSIENSMAVRLWENRGISYELVFENEEVKIYKR